MIAPFSRPLYVMAKAAGSACNMRCRYCYYLDKHQYYPTDKAMIMPDDVLEEFIRQYIEAQTTPRVLFTWHGGESLLRPIAFYEKVLRLQAKYARGVGIDNAIQTNGTLITDDWSRFFKDHGWLVGLSIDGPREAHDRYRRTAQGGDSFDAVMRGIESLNKFGVDWNAMAVVNDRNAERPLDFYHFFKSIDCRYIQFAPIVERLTKSGLAEPPAVEGNGVITNHPSNNGVIANRPSSGVITNHPSFRVAPWSVTARQWGEFLCTIFDEWVRNDVGTTFVQIFDSTLANWLGAEPSLCTLGRTCGHAAAVEHNGDLYSCDHYVFPKYLLGNIMHDSIFDLMGSQRQQDFGNAKLTGLPRQCRECPALPLCNGECPKNRFLTTLDGEPGLNYLCRGYRRFFNHSAEAMAYMRDAILNNRAPSEVMAAMRAN